MNTFSLQNPWFPGFLERMACCALPPNNINDIIVMNDNEEDRGDIAEPDDLELEESSHKPLSRKVPIRWHLSQSALATNNLPSPTLSPSRRELDRWDPSCMGIPACCTPSYAGSTATTASIMSEEEEYVGNNNNNNDPQGSDEIRSNATTQVISHRKKNTRRNELLSSSLASAEKMLKQQLHEEELRAQALKARGWSSTRLKR